MRNIILPLIILFCFPFGSCGPAAEDKATMIRLSQRIADSIALLIKSQLQEAEMPAQVMMAPPTPPQGTAIAQGSTAPTQTPSNPNPGK